MQEATMNRLTRTFEVIIYDVWGNERDGWEVNDATNTHRNVSIPDDATDREVVLAVYDAITAEHVEVDPNYQSEDTFYLRAKMNHRPIMELRLVVDER